MPMSTNNPSAGDDHERWLTKRELAHLLNFSTRWIEIQVRRGMPSLLIGGQRRFRYSQVEPWLFAVANGGQHV